MTRPNAGGDEVTETQTLYKVLVGGQSCHGGSLKWSLPQRAEDGSYTPGDWHRVSGDLTICERGIHLTTAPYQSWWRWDAELYEAEAEGIAAWDGDKCVCRAARLLRPAPVPAWWQACRDFVATIPQTEWFQHVQPPDPAWRVFPTRDAAWAADWGAARDAAWAAARAAARDAAWAAARAAARDAAWAAARDAAWAAAWDAAGDAAWAAAMAAAGDAAWAAARDAAGDAALYVLACGICADLPLADAHRQHAAARWRVWWSGYGLACDVQGVLYVYERP
jgi:hypothetical protein